MKELLTSIGRLEVADQLQELRPRQLVKFLELANRWPAAKESGRLIVAMTLQPACLLLSDLSHRQWVSLSMDERYQIEQITRKVLLQHVAFVPFGGSFRFKRTRYYLPAEGFADSSAVEVALSNIWYTAFAHPERPNVAALFHLLGTICRPAPRKWYQVRRPDAPVRVEFDSAESETRAKLFESLPVGYCIAILQYWEWQNGLFLARYKDLFEAGEDDEPLYQAGEGWIACLEDVGEAGTYGRTDKVFLENVHTIWGFMRRKHIKIKKMERDAERANEE